MPRAPDPDEPVVTVVFQPGGRRCPADAGQTLLEVAQHGGVALASVCGGAGTCGTCVVRVVRGAVDDVVPEEQARLSTGELGAGLRLACRAQVAAGSDAAERGDVVVEVLPGSRLGAQTSQTASLALPGPAQGSPPSRHTAGDRQVGLAVDLGTTGLAAYLVAPDGAVLAAVGAPNPQISFGEDVMSRLAVALADPPRTSMMRDALAQEVDRLAGELCAAAGVSRDDVGRAVVVGNTAMHHLFFGLPVTSLAWAPYVPFEAGERTVPADSLGIRLGAGATVTSPPVVAGFVGSDHVAMLVAAGAGDAHGTATGVTAYLDVGTNTEISLVTADGHWTCSAASGPAFEGAHIEAGMRAARGAIDRVAWHDGGLRTSTIEAAPAVGICGSGLLDAVAVLRAQGAVTDVGALVAGHPLVTGVGRASCVVLAPPAPGSPRAVRLTRRDVGEVQLAKGAVRAGLRLLTEAAGIGEGDIERIVLAGAFGTYLDVASAIEIGLLPSMPPSAVQQIGNGAGAGACLLLGDAGRRSVAATLVERITYLELTGHPDFQDRFTQALRLVPDPWTHG